MAVVAEVAPPVPIPIRTALQAILAMDAAHRSQQQLPNRRRHRLPAFHQQQQPLKLTQKQMALQMGTRTIAPVVPVTVTLIQNQILKVNQTEQTTANYIQVVVAAPQVPLLQGFRTRRWRRVITTTKMMRGCYNHNKHWPPAMPAPTKMMMPVTALTTPRPHLPAVAVAAA